MLSLSDTFVVAGNGPSLDVDLKGRVLSADTIVRTNNFFFETQSNLGQRVDLAVMGGDPRVSPFMFETLWNCRNTYDIRSWTSHNPRVVKAGQRRFRTRFKPFPVLQPHVAGDVDALKTSYQAKPLTGAYAALAAYAYGAKTIILTGFDLYSQPRRYSYDAGPQQIRLLGDDLNSRGVDQRQHNLDLDLSIFELLQKQPDCTLYRLTDHPALTQIMDLAPIRAGDAPHVVPTNPPRDWVNWAGFYPLRALRVMRATRALLPTR